MVDQDRRPEPRGDEGELFREFNDQLMRAISRNVRVSSPQVVEDACALAWSRFLVCQPDRDRHWQGWLFRVAQHECWRIEREAQAHVPIKDIEFRAGRVHARRPAGCLFAARWRG